MVEDFDYEAHHITQDDDATKLREIIRSLRRENEVKNEFFYPFLKPVAERRKDMGLQISFDIFAHGTHFQNEAVKKSINAIRVGKRRSSPFIALWLETLCRYFPNNARQFYDDIEKPFPQKICKYEGEKIENVLPKNVFSDLQPTLSLRLSENSEETRFIYRSRSIPYIRAKEAFTQLVDFSAHESDFLWHIVYGSGGTGKSRLALERRDFYKNAIGFLSVDEAKSFDWNHWQPLTPTFIIIDYAAREVDLVTRIVRALSMREDLSVPVRLLLLERDLTGAWFDKLTHRGRVEHAHIEKCWYGKDGALEAPSDVWPIIQHMCRDARDNLPSKEEALSELDRIDHQCRPLYAAFLGDAYFRGENPRNWDAFALVENVLQHEKRYWESGGVDQSHINLCVCATSTGGVPAEWIEHYSIGDFKDFWPRWKGNKTLDVLSAIYGGSIVDDIPPLEPDLLGEVFFLEYWKTASRFERRHVIEYGSSMAPWFAEFTERMVSDFPEHTSFELLRNVLSSDLREFEKAKPELIYNIITNLAGEHSKIALEVFGLFKVLDTKEFAEYAAECIVDSALNLIVGVEELEIDHALDIYKFQKDSTSELSSRLELDKSKCAVALSFIAKYPLAEPETFRSILADVLQMHRTHREDDAIRRDACIAITNYVNLLGAEQIKQAVKLLGLFRWLAKENHEDDMEDAWLFILYHVFLLSFVELKLGDISSAHEAEPAFEKLKHLAPEAESYKETIFKLFQDELDSEIEYEAS